MRQAREDILQLGINGEGKVWSLVTLEGEKGRDSGLERARSLNGEFRYRGL